MTADFADSRRFSGEIELIFVRLVPLVARILLLRGLRGSNPGFPSFFFVCFVVLCFLGLRVKPALGHPWRILHNSG